MALTSERRVALELMGVEGVRLEIAESRELLAQLLGDLYPEILIAEIDEMEAILREMTRPAPVCRDCAGTGIDRSGSVIMVCPCVEAGKTR